MPVNKLALLRYKTIDQCLQNRFRKWTIEDLMEAVSNAIYEYEGITTGVSKRTLQLDLQNMRSDKLGYNAPIIVESRKFYTYADRNYSITNTPISGLDLDKLKEVIGFLRQFKGFGFFEDLTGIVTRLEYKVDKKRNQQVNFIQFETNEQLKGLNHIDPIHQAIRNKTTLYIRYQSFRADKYWESLFYPFLLKEYNNRWFVLGRSDQFNSFSLLALDRIIALKKQPLDPYMEVDQDLINHYFDDVIGVTRPSGQEPIKILLRIKKTQYPYLLTKPMHSSQKMEKEEEDTVIISLKVYWNYELERELIGLGEAIEILEPIELRDKVITRLKATLKLYNI